MAFEKELKVGSQTRGLAVRFSNFRTRPPPELEDVTILANELANDCTQHHRHWYPHAMNTVMFLQHLLRLFAIGTLFINEPRISAASTVWAAVRLALEASVPFLSLFHKFTEMMLRCGRFSQFRVDSFHQILQCDEVQALANEYLAIAVEISTKVVTHVLKPAFVQLGSTFVSNFESHVSLLVKQLEAIDLTMRRYAEATPADMGQSTARQLTSRMLSLVPNSNSNRKAIDRVSRKNRLLKSLCANQEEFEQTYRQHRRKGNSTWLFMHEVYRDWEQRDQSSCLWLRGKLGSGKSIVLASAIAKLGLRHAETTCLDLDMADLTLVPRTLSFFFATTLRPRTLKASTLLGCLAYQILTSKQMAGYLKEYLDRKIASHTVLRSSEASVDILLDVTPKSWKGDIVIDGFESYSKEEATIVIGELERLKKHRSIKMICSSRTSWELFDMAATNLGPTSILTMEEVDRSSEIELFISSKMAEWRSIRSLTSEQEDLIRRQLMLWNGMFLWLTLQLEFISSDLYSDMAILEIWRNLPKELPEVFDRALLQLSDREFAVKAYKLVAAADEPMMLNELRTAVNVTPGDNRWNPILDSSTSFLSRYGGNLLELDVETETVHFIHDSVRWHLLGKETNPKASPFHFDSEEARIILAEVILTYLTYPAFEQHLTDSSRTPPAQMQSQVFQVPQHVARSVLPPQPWIQKTFGRVGGMRKLGPAAIDLELLLKDLDAAKAKASKITMESLLNYAKAHWLTITSTFSFSNGFRPRWFKIMQGQVSIVKPPFQTLQLKKDPRPAVAWALLEGHSAVFEYCREDLGNERCMKIATDVILGRHENIRYEDVRLTGPILRPVINFALSADFIDTGMRFSEVLKKVVWLMFRRHTLAQQWLGDLATQREKAELQNIARDVLRDLISSYKVNGFELYQCCTDMRDYISLDEPLSNDLTPFQYALQCNAAKGSAMRVDNVEQLLRLGADPDRNMSYKALSPLLQASKDGNSTIMKLLLQHGASVN